MTKSERIKHKVLVQELFSGKTKREINLMIRNRNIVVRYSLVAIKKPDSNNTTLHQPQILPDVLPQILPDILPQINDAGHHHKALNLT